MFLVAPRTLRAVGVDDHCNRGLGFGCRGNLNEMPNPVNQPLAEINPQHRSQFAVVQRHQNK